jgi:membrane protein insertase Oxa1/YidC/SpoIIIJ
MTQFSMLVLSRRGVNLLCGQHLAATVAHQKCAPFSTRILPEDAPAGIKHFFQYGSDCYLTHGIEACISEMYSAGVPWAGAFMLSGLAVRLLTVPTQLYAEKLFTHQFWAKHLSRKNTLQKFAEHYRIKLKRDNEKGYFLDTKDPKILHKADLKSKELYAKYAKDHGITSARILCVRYTPMALWICSAFALKNIAQGDVPRVIEGILWFKNMNLPDPYFIFPIAFGVTALFIQYAQRYTIPVHMTDRGKSFYEIVTPGFIGLCTIFLTQMPAYMSSFFFLNSATGLALNLAMRYPKVRKAIGIRPLPIDSDKPLRDLISRIRTRKTFL